jgi:hypothetical protein
VYAEGEDKMKFESKHVIRWGIPGWVFLTLIFLALKIANFTITGSFISHELKKPTELLSSIVSFALIGVPVGYLLYQSYFYTFWIRNNRNEKKYFEIEYKFHKSVLNLDTPEKMQYVSDRYRHLLGRVHDLGSLLMSLIISIIIIIFMAIFSKAYILFLLPAVLTFTAIDTYKHYIYFSKNVNYFRDCIIKDFYDKHP